MAAPLEAGERTPSTEGFVEGLATRLRRRVTGEYTIDEFGLDVELIEMLDPVFNLLARSDVRGAEHVPATGPAVIIANRRVGLAEPIALGRGVRLASGRRVRFLGIPDVAPVGPLLRRMGGALSRPEDMRALLRAGHVVSMPLSRSVLRHRAGRIHPFHLQPALQVGAPVIPAAIVGRELGNRWKVVVGTPIHVAPGSGPLALAELADDTRAAVQELLDDALPPHWLLG